MGAATATDLGGRGAPFCSIVLIARGSIRLDIRVNLGQGVLLVALIVVWGSEDCSVMLKK